MGQADTCGGIILILPQFKSQESTTQKSTASQYTILPGTAAAQWTSAHCGPLTSSVKVPATRGHSSLAPRPKSAVT